MTWVATHFRKINCGAKRAYLPRTLLVPAKSRTTNLGPFGEVIRATSSITPAIPIRWSTKYTDLETDLVYYGHRYYNPSTGRWPSRDPIGEKGGLNLYGFVRNDPQNTIDPFGLFGCSRRQCCECVTDVWIDGYTIVNQPVTIGGVPGLSFGHEIRYKVTVEYKECAKSATSSLQYIENTDVPPPNLARLGMLPSKDFDTYGAVINSGQTTPEGFAEWRYRNLDKEIPCSGKKTFTISDRPVIGAPSGVARTRRLDTSLVLTNPSGCDTPNVVAWTQNLVWDGSVVTRQQLDPR